MFTFVYYGCKDTNFKWFYPQVTNFLGIKHKKLSYIRIFVVTHDNRKKGKVQSVLKSAQTIYFWKVLDKTSILKKT